MKKASDYLRHAEDCRRLAAAMEGEQRDQLLNMAKVWEQLASDRAELVAKHPELTLRDDEPR